MEAKVPAALGQAWAEHRIPLMAALVAKLGDLDRAEDALAEAALRAQQSWTAAIPANPSGWLYRVALNVARDGYRRDARRAMATPDLMSHLTSQQADTLSVSPETRLDLLRLCADPVLSQDQQIALMLFHLAGLDCAAIARAFLATEATIYQRLSRARAKLRARDAETEASRSLETVRSCLELIYWQDYTNIRGGTETTALGQDALHLTMALCEAASDDAENWALLALLSCLESRRPARLSDQGAFIPFHDQDISQWDNGSLHRAAQSMQTVATLATEAAPYGLRAQIELTRMIARRENSACDEALLSLYDQLIALHPGPFAAIERALVLARIAGAEIGLAALKAIETHAALSGHAGWHLAKAELHGQLGDRARTRLHLKAALTLIDGPAEKAFILAKLQGLPS